MMPMMSTTMPQVGTGAQEQIVVKLADFGSAVQPSIHQASTSPHSILPYLSTTLHHAPLPSCVAFTVRSIAPGDA